MRTGLYDLGRATDDPIVDTRCLLEQTDGSDERSCPAHGPWVAHRSTRSNSCAARELRKTG